MSLADTIELLSVMLPYGCFLVVWHSIYHVWVGLVRNDRENMQLRTDFEHLLGATSLLHGVTRRGGECNGEVIGRVIDGVFRAARARYSET